jgi:hypothetical protein
VIGEEGPFKADYVTSCMAAMALMGIEYKDVNGRALHEGRARWNCRLGAS